LEAALQSFEEACLETAVYDEVANAAIDAGIGACQVAPFGKDILHHLEGGVAIRLAWAELSTIGLHAAEAAVFFGLVASAGPQCFGSTLDHSSHAIGMLRELAQVTGTSRNRIIKEEATHRREPVQLSLDDGAANVVDLAGEMLAHAEIDRCHE